MNFNEQKIETALRRFEEYSKEERYKQETKERIERRIWRKSLGIDDKMNCIFIGAECKGMPHGHQKNRDL